MAMRAALGLLLLRPALGGEWYWVPAGFKDGNIRNGYDQKQRAVAIYDTNSVKQDLGQWGSYSVAEKCSGKGYAWKVKVRSEASQNTGDDTALNAIEIECKDANGQILGRNLECGDFYPAGYWGTWTSWDECNGKLIGARMKVEKSLGGSDDTAANKVQFRCKEAGKQRTEMKELGQTSWGEWSTWTMCDDGQHIAGLQQIIEKNQGGDGDDTALNAIRIYCKADSETVANIYGAVEGGNGEISLDGESDDSTSCWQPSEGSQELSAEKNSSKQGLLELGEKVMPPRYDSGGDDDTCRCPYVGSGTDVSVQYLCQTGDICYNQVNGWCAEDENICEIPL